MDFLQPLGLGEDSLPHQVDDHGQDGANEEEPQQRAVHRTIGKESTGSESTPNHAGVEVRTREGAREAVGGVCGADLWDVVESPVENGDLTQRTDDEAY